MTRLTITVLGVLGIFASVFIQWIILEFWGERLKNFGKEKMAKVDCVISTVLGYLW